MKSLRFRVLAVVATAGCTAVGAFDDLEERKKAFDSGAMDFLSKPFSLSRLNQVIESRFSSITKRNKENGKNSGD